MPSRPRPIPPRLRDHLTRLFGSLFARVLLSLVIVSIALATALAIALTDSASSSLTSEAKQAKTAAAVTVARSTHSWLDVRRDDLRSLSSELTFTGASQRPLTRLLGDFSDFSGAWVYTTTGRRSLAAGRAGAPAAIGAQPWFTGAVAGASTISPVADDAGSDVLFLATPLHGAGGARSVLVVATPTATLAPLVDGVAPGRTGEALLVDGSRRLVVSSLSGDAPLRTQVSSRAATAGLAGGTGALVYRDYQGRQAVGAYAPVGTLHWTAIVKQNTSVAFAATSHQRTLALVFILVGLLLTLCVAYLVARALSQPLVELQRTAAAVADGDLSARVRPSGATENRRLGQSFNAMLADIESLLVAVRGAGGEMTSSSAELSAAAEQLASATTEQSSASTETSATMEELARTSASIAEHADGAAERCVETQDALRDAEEGMRASSERTMALAKQVDEISTILDLINSIADKTAVLSLNAAIEAARAGESGAGFTVVSEEVGRLAERSKASASHISEIVRATQQDATATVMAMEAGGKQMRRGLDLMEEVTTAASQVQLTTQQQRTATVQVVDTMASLSESARQTSATTQQIAESAANLSALAAELRCTASAVREDGGPTAPVDARRDRVTGVAHGGREARRGSASEVWSPEAGSYVEAPRRGDPEHEPRVPAAAGAGTNGDGFRD